MARFWVVEKDLSTMLLRAWSFQGQSPLYYLLAWIPIHAVGESEAALRVPSLVLGCLFCAVLYPSARRLSGTDAGAFAVVLGWFSAPAISASAEARPYGLVLFSVASAVGAFCWAVQTGSRRARMAWVLAGAAVAWSHYVQYALVAGLFISYGLFSDLRTEYPAKRFAVDGILQIALVSVCTPQILALFLRRQTLSWIDHSNHLVFLPVLLPFVLAIVLGESYGRHSRGRVNDALGRSLWVCLLTHVVVLELTAVAGMNLLHSLYILSILVPALLLAARAFSEVRFVHVLGGLVAFAVVTGMELAGTKLSTGSFSGMGIDDWRGAVAELSTRLHGVNDPLVLFRSGFVEEDLLPLGSPPAATLAPLRSPGREPFTWPVTSLTYRWSTPEREAYFKNVVAPSVAKSSRFFVLSAIWGYPDQIVEWVHSVWPGRFDERRSRFGGIELLEFRQVVP